MQSTTMLLSRMTAADLRVLISDILKTERELLKKPENRKEEILTRKEVARYLKIDISTLWRWEECGKLHPRRIGRRVIYMRSDIDNILNLN